MKPRNERRSSPILSGAFCIKITSMHEKGTFSAAYPPEGGRPRSGGGWFCKEIVIGSRWSVVRTRLASICTGHPERSRRIQKTDSRKYDCCHCHQTRTDHRTPTTDYYFHPFRLDAPIIALRTDKRNSMCKFSYLR